MAKERKIFLIAEHLRSRVPGGIGTHTMAILSNLVSLKSEFPNLDFEMVATRVKGKDPLLEIGLPIRYISLPHSIFMRVNDFKVPILGRNEGIYHSFTMQIPAVIGSGQRKVVTVHDIAFDSHPEFYTTRGLNWHRRQLRLLAKGNEEIITVSSRTKSDLTRYGIDARRISVAESGSDHLGSPDFIAADDLLAMNSVNGKYLVSVSTLEPRKNLSGLIDAFLLARSQQEENISLVVIGPKGWGDHRERNVEGVYFVGSVEPSVLSALYKRAEALVYVPFYEGYGLPVVEAMASGTPVICSDVPSAAGACEIVNPSNVISIAKGIEKILNDTKIREDLVKRGLKRTSDLTWMDAARKHLKLWEKI